MFQDRLLDKHILSSDEPHVFVSEFLKHIHSEHVVMFDDEPGMSSDEKKLLDEIRKIRITPKVLKRAEKHLFFSFGLITCGEANCFYKSIGLRVHPK